MNKRVKNTDNPLAQGDPKEVVRLIASLMRETPEDTRTEEEVRLFEEARARRSAAWHEARFGSLPENTYRLLEQGSIVGWYYELEVAGETYALARENETVFDLHGDVKSAFAIARQKLAKLLGDAAAEKAEFRFMFGGQI